jgi:hypothetical protein
VIQSSRRQIAVKPSRRVVALWGLCEIGSRALSPSLWQESGDAQRQQPDPEPDPAVPVGDDIPLETKEVKKVRLQREKEEKKANAEAKKLAKKQAADDKKQAAKLRRIQAGEDPDAIAREEASKKLTAEATEVKRLYSSILLMAQVPVHGVDAGEHGWAPYKDTRWLTISRDMCRVKVHHLSQVQVGFALATCGHDTVFRRLACHICSVAKDAPAFQTSVANGEAAK